MSFSYLLESDNLTRDQLRKYNVSELQGILSQLNLDSNGKKHELVDRLYQFWLSIQSPASAAAPAAEPKLQLTCCVKCQFTEDPDFFVLRTKLETYGQTSGVLFDPDESLCYVSYKKSESVQGVLRDAAELGFSDARCVAESELEKRSRELELIADNMQLHNVSQKRFRRTQTEPKIFWCYAPDVDEDS
jgi:hypothetical protein